MIRAARQQSRTGVSRPVAAGVLLWGAVLALGGIKLVDYASRPGPSGQTPLMWPPDSRLPAPNQHPTLVMFVHPRCPCSHASVANLARVMAHAQHKLDACMVFVLPPGAPQAWAHGALWNQAAAIPGVEVRIDEEGIEAERFKARTSGHVLVYDARGRQVFSGGLTPARGHEGDCVGTQAVRQFCLTGVASSDRAPVFGCALQNTGPSATAPQAAFGGGECQSCLKKIYR